MKKLFLLLALSVAIGANAQITKASLQASGLTCAICSRAVTDALQRLGFVEKVQVDIKSQQYNLSFKKDAFIDFDEVNKAVEDAGFSIASLKITAILPDIKLQADEHFTIGNQRFHFLNSKTQPVLNGPVNFSLVDKGFVSTAAFKKYAAMTKMPCIKTGRMAKCCTPGDAVDNARIYHVVI